MSKREVDSREEDQRKRQKCDISDEEDLSEVIPKVADPSNLWPQFLLEEENEELEQEELEGATSSIDCSFETDEGSPPYFGSIGQFSDDGSILKSSQGSSSSSDSAKGISVPPTRDVFLKFLRDVPTNKWNGKENARQVFKNFRIRPYIVHPEHLLSRFYDDDVKELRIANLLDNLEKERQAKFGLPWSKLEKSVEEFIAIYECEGLEELADIHSDRRQQVRARKLFRAFKKKLEEVNQITWTHSELLSIVRFMIKQTGNNCGRTFEELFEEYIRFLINFIQGNLSMFQRKITLQLTFPECKAFTEFERDVIPDIIIVSRIGKAESIVVVGEIKTVGSDGRRFESHKGKKLKGVKKSGDMRDSETVEPVASTSIADTSDETHPGTEADGEKTLVEDEEPDHADAVTGNKVEDKEPDHADAVKENKVEDKEPDHADAVKENKVKDKEPDHADAVKENKEDILRYLNRKEKYKVRCYLPQLLSHMMTAMQWNTVPTMRHTMKEQYQIGFAVEGWKLRFVKLVVRDYLDRFNGRGKPALVHELLKGKPLKCDVYITQEFNLLKGRHVKMFFRMLVAIAYNNALMH